MCRTEEVLRTLPVAQPEYALAIVGPAPTGLVRLLGQQRRKVHLLSTDRVHLLAHDALDIAQHAVAQRQPSVDAWSGAADVASTHQPAMARHLGVGRILAQRADKQLRHSGDHPSTVVGSALPSAGEGCDRVEVRAVAIGGVDVDSGCVEPDWLEWPCGAEVAGVVVCGMRVGCLCRRYSALACATSGATWQRTMRSMASGSSGSSPRSQFAC